MGQAITVIGGGIMGAGIAHVARVAGCSVTVVEADAAFVEPARDRVEHYSERAKSRGADLSGIGSFDVTTDLAAAVGAADIVVEAVSENLQLKESVFAKIGAAASPDAVLASNTSGLPIEVLGAASNGHEAQVVGLHFFNPVPAMKLVEVIRAPGTSDATMQKAVAFCELVGKETVEVRDLPGFITTRLGCILMCEAIRALEQGVATKEHIDRGMQLGYNHPMGPLALADRIGLDTLLSILDGLREAWGEAFRPPPLLRQMVAAGKLGNKTGRGFYTY